MSEKNKLSSADLTKIRVMRDYGMTLLAIAKEFGVTEPAITYALRRVADRRA